MDGPEEYRFYTLSDTTVLWGDTLVFVNAHTRELRFTAGRTASRSAGTTGDGPGDFQRPTGMRQTGLLDRLSHSWNRYGTLVRLVELRGAQADVQELLLGGSASLKGGVGGQRVLFVVRLDRPTLGPWPRRSRPARVPHGGEGVDHPVAPRAV